MYQFAWALVKHEVTGTVESARQVRIIAETLNPVWQKFCQTLACREDIIGKVLAHELSSLLDDCPSHSHDHTCAVMKDLDVKFSTEFTDETLIGSGTIAQVYRMFSQTHDKWVAVKVKHPHIKECIDDAMEQYTSLSNAFWFPSNIKQCGSEFFHSLYRQADFGLEFQSGTAMKEMLRDSKLFVVPEMIAVSESAIIMEYEAGHYHLPDITDAEIKAHVCLIIIYFQIASIYHGVLHADMHWGNFSVRLNPLQIVLYDFGLVLDMRSMDTSQRHTWAQAFLNNDAGRIFSFMAPSHITPMKKILSSLPEGTLFSTQIKRLLLYCQTHAVVYDVTIMSILYACMNCEQLEKMLPIVPSQSEALRVLKYPDFDDLRTLNV